MKPWLLLPNAHHIDWVIQSVKSNFNVWEKPYDEAWYEAFNAARDVARDTDRDEAFDEARREAFDAHINAAIISILALVAYDDCDQYLSMTYEQLKVYAALSDKPQALLLLPMKWVQENETMVTAA